MYPLIAALIALAIVLLVWRYMDPRREDERNETREIWQRRMEQREQQRQQQRRARRSGPPKIVAPDDDPEFLRELRKQIRKDQPAKETKDGDEEQPS